MSDSQKSKLDPKLDPDLDVASLKVQGPIRRNLWLLVAVVAVLGVGPALSRLLSSYRAVVLEVRGEEMLLGYNELPPDWVDATAARPGQILYKAHWSWHPDPVESGPLDDKLVALYERYASSYEGVVSEIVPPPVAGGTSSAVVRLTDGSQIVVNLASPSLAKAAAKDRVVKTPNTWDPVIEAVAPTAETEVAPTRPPPESAPPAGTPPPEQP